jgi:hypothetical protein
MKFLIKRNPKFSNKGFIEYDLKDGWKTEVTIKSFPISKNAFIDNSEVYIAESGYAIFGKGFASKIDFYEFTFKELLNFGYNESAIRTETIFWNDRIKKCFNYLKTQNLDISYEKPIFKVLQFQLINCESLNPPLPLDKKFLKQATWYYLKDDFNIDNNSKLNIELNLRIPSHVRSECFYKYSLAKSPKLLIDVDHFVPKSVGGPGNIIENLIPLGHVMNIVKSNSIPSFLFSYGKEFNINIPKDLNWGVNIYHKSPVAIEIARQIVSQINLNFHSAKEIYLDIKKSHFPNIDH